MVNQLFYILFGYLSGSLLFAEITARIAGKKDMLRNSRDGNPGVASAFGQCGFVCGVATLLGDILKGFLPVFCFLQFGGDFNTFSVLKPLIFAAPVIGHAFPIFYRFKGGKAIAVTFGCLLGFLPMWQPLVIHAALYIFFSLIIRVTPHFYRTIVTYFTAFVVMGFFHQTEVIMLGYFIVMAVVFCKHYFSTEPRQKGQVHLLWLD